MKTPDNYYKQAAEELNLPVNLVKKVNAFYWKEGIKKQLANVVYDAIYIKNFGTICVSPKKLYFEIKDEIAKIRNIYYSPKFTEKKKNLILDYKYENLRKLLKKRNDLAIYRLEQKKLKDERTFGIPEIDTESID